MLADPAPRPARCYDPATPPHRDEQGVHVYDYATIRALLRDPQRVTSDVTEMLTPEELDHLHPVSSFVWATDRRTMSGCPGRHAALRSAGRRAGGGARRVAAHGRRGRRPPRGRGGRPAGQPVPQSSRFAREPFTVGDVTVQPEEQVLMWLTAANRDVPGPHRVPLDRFDPWREDNAHLGWGSGYHLCGGVHHALAVAVTAVCTLAERLPQLGLAGPWQRFVGIDDGFSAAPVVPFVPVMSG